MCAYVRPRNQTRCVLTTSQLIIRDALRDGFMPASTWVYCSSAPELHQYQSAMAELSTHVYSCVDTPTSGFLNMGEHHMGGGNCLVEFMFKLVLTIS